MPEAVKAPMDAALDARVAYVHLSRRPFSTPTSGHTYALLVQYRVCNQPARHLRSYDHLDNRKWQYM